MRLRWTEGQKAVAGICLAVLVGGLLRHLYLEEMEFKYDEKYMYLAVRRALDDGVWSTLGMPSGVRTRNPGLSVWFFNLLGWLFQARSPLELCRAVAWTATASLAMLGAFIWFKIPAPARSSWWWALALVAVNPIAVVYHRKIWTVCVLSFFLVPFLWAYWDRGRRAGAFFWGVLGAMLGQIHMPGFFFALAFVLPSLLGRAERARIRWRFWFAGSMLGTLPLLPWLAYLVNGPSSGRAISVVAALRELLQLRFWSFWFSDPTGLSLGYFLGLHRGPSQLDKNGVFMRYPMVGETATYGVAFCMVASVLIAVAIFGLAAVRVIRQQRHRDRPDFDSDTHQAVWRGGGWYGVLLSLAGTPVRRHYMPMSFPLEYVWFCREAVRALGRRTAPVLGALVVFQLLTSIAFLQFIVRNGGSVEGDYGASYRVQEEKGETWTQKIIVHD